MRNCKQQIELQLKQITLRTGVELDQLDIYTYYDYRKYLSDFFSEKKKLNPRYSFTTFASKGQLGSRSYISLVIEGKRNLGLNSVYKFARALNLGDKELKYFLCLVSFNQSKSDREKEELYESLRQMRPEESIYPDEEKQERFFSDWRLPVLYTLLLAESEARSAAWVRSYLLKDLKLREVRSLLEELVKLGFAEFVQDEKWRAIVPGITSSDEKPSFGLKSFHRSMLQQAIEAIDMPLEDREISSATIKISQKDYESIKRRLKDTRTLLCKDTPAESVGSRKVYQLNIQLFPLTKEIKRESK